MTKLRKYLSDACEEIDAGVFSGDVLYCDDERKELKAYVERWSRAIAALETADTHLGVGKYRSGDGAHR